MTTSIETGDLPEELVAEARKIATAWCAHVLVDGATDTIARALMAERERAARIARKVGETHLNFAAMGMPVEPSKIIAEDRARVANRIATVILSDKDQSHVE